MCKRNAGDKNGNQHGMCKRNSPHKKSQHGMYTRLPAKTDASVGYVRETPQIKIKPARDV